MAAKVVVPPAKSISELYRLTFKVLDFKGEWLDLIGTPEVAGSWMIWGNSGNGKTRFALQLAKYLCEFQKVYYNTLEEGGKLTFRKACKENAMEAVKGQFFYGKEKLPELIARLEKRRSPNVIVIDSLQHFRIGKREYYDLIERFPKKLFIFISHARGQEPKGEVADEIRYNSDVKIRVERFVAKPVENTRYGGYKPYTIWEEGARNAELKLT